MAFSPDIVVLIFAAQFIAYTIKGLIGFGNIARQLVRITSGFRRKVIAYDAYLNDAGRAFAREYGVELADCPEEVYRRADIVSLHIPSTPETRGSITYDLIMSMRKNGVLVNTARQDIIDEDGLIRAMTERTDLHYVTDLKLKDHERAIEALGDRYLFTPKKMGAQTKEANVNAGLAAAQQIVDFFVDGVKKYQVNK